MHSRVFILLIYFYSYVFADTGEYKTYYEQIAGGGWKLVRRVGRGENWHPASDQLQGNDTYGTFFDNPTLSRTFSRRFDNEPFDQFLFSTGDGKKWLVTDRAQVLDYYTDRQRMIQTSAASQGIPYAARWSRRKSRKEDPQVCLKDCARSVSRGLMLYSEGKSEKGAKQTLVPHNGGNVFIRQRMYKVYVSGCCDYTMQGHVRKDGRVWGDRTYRWKSFPSFLEGGTIAYGPYRHLPENTELGIRVTHPSVVYILLTAKPDRRNGGLDNTLPRNGWKKLPKQAHWGPKKRKYPMDIYRKLIVEFDILPPTTTEQTVLAVIGKRRFYYVGEGACVTEMEKMPCHFYKTQTSVHSCQKKCHLFEECIGWANSGAGEKKCFLYFQETAGVVKSQKLLDHVWGGQNCGGMVIVKSSNDKSQEYPCFSKKDMDDKLVFQVKSKAESVQSAVGDVYYGESWPEDFFADDDERRALRRILMASVGDMYDEDHSGEVFEEGELDETALANDPDDMYDSLEMEQALEDADRVKQEKEDHTEVKAVAESIENDEEQARLASSNEETTTKDESASLGKKTDDKSKEKVETKEESTQDQGQAAVSEGEEANGVPKTMSIKGFPHFFDFGGEEEEEDDAEMKMLIKQIGSTPCPDDKHGPIVMDKYAAAEDEEEEEMEDEDEGGDPIVPKKSLKPKCPNPCPDNKAGDGLEAKETKDSQGNKIVEKKDASGVIRELERKNKEGDKVVEKKDSSGKTTSKETYKDGKVIVQKLDAKGQVTKTQEKTTKPPLDVKRAADLKDANKDMRKKEGSKKDYPDKNQITDSELTKLEAKEAVDFKEADSGEVCCHFGPIVPMSPYQKIWRDRSFQFRKGVPGYMNGGKLVRGPHLIPQGKKITITATRSCIVYLLVSVGERNGGWPEKLIKGGWTQMDEEVSWHRPMTIFMRPVEHDLTLPTTKTRYTVMAIIYKEPLTRGGNLLCYNGAMKDELLLQDPFKFVDRDPTREACRYRCLQDYESQGYSYQTNGNSHECRCGKRGKRMDLLLQDKNDKLNHRKPCEADDVSFFGWCTCETVIVHDIQSSCYGASETGIYTLRDVNAPVFCDMEFAHGNWLLLATQKDAKDQYEGTTSPFVASKNPVFPSRRKPYSRDWRLLANIDPTPGDEFMIRRGESNDYVRFVVDKWCGWGDRTRNCADNEDTDHPFLAKGTLYDHNGNVKDGFKYFNGCALGGECGKDGIDGVGFGTKAGILSTKDGAKAYGGAVPGGLFWGSDKADSGDKLPYSYYYRPSEKKGFVELQRLNNLRIERVATRERYEKSYLTFNSKEDHGKLEKLGLRGEVPENLVMRGTDPDKSKEKTVASRKEKGRSSRERRRRSDRKGDKPRRRNRKRDESMDGLEVAVGMTFEDSDEVAVGESQRHRSRRHRSKDKHRSRRRKSKSKGAKGETAVGTPPKSMKAGLSALPGVMAVRCLQEIMHRYAKELHFRQTRNDMSDRDDRRHRRERAERGVNGDAQDRGTRSERSTQGDRKNRADRYEKNLRVESLDRYDRADRLERSFRDEIAEMDERNERRERMQRGERGEYGQQLERVSFAEIGERQSRGNRNARLARARQSERQDRADRAEKELYNHLFEFTARQQRENQDYRNDLALRNQEMRPKVSDKGILENFGDEFSRTSVRQVKPSRRRLLEDS